jgi:hypothetical protein
MLSGVVAGIAACAGVAMSLAHSPDPNPRSGVEKGGMLSAFHPTHVTGSDKNTDTCPVCKYPSNPAVQVWINTDDDKNVGAIASALEKDVRANRGEKMKAFVVFINPGRQASGEITRHLKAMAEQNKIENVSLVYLPGPDSEPVSEYKINTDPNVKNTVFVYRNRKVDTKFINFVADSKGLSALDAAVKSVLKQRSEIGF